MKIKDLIAFIFAALLCLGCSPKRAELPTPVSELWEGCEKQCSVNSDCAVMQGHSCMVPIAGHKNDLICYEKAFDKYRESGILNNIKCQSQGPIESYIAQCENNICVAKDLRPAPEPVPPVESPVESQVTAITPPKSIDIRPNPQHSEAVLLDPKIPNPKILGRFDGKDAAFPWDSKWQFAGWQRKPVEELAPNFQIYDKPFIAFSYKGSAKGNMWGHDGDVFFHRNYEVNLDSLILTPDSKRCDMAPCMDRDYKINSRPVPKSGL